MQTTLPSPQEKDSQFKNDPRFVMRDVVEGWRKRIGASLASKDRVGFMTTAKMCDGFFAGSMGLMWSDSFRQDFLGGMPCPKFKITIAKAFELVAIMGPSVVWDAGGRVIKTRKRRTIPRSMYGEDGDQQAEQRYQLHVANMKRDLEEEKFTCGLLEDYLNYGPTEQPSGLLSEANKAITEAIVKGRGCIMVEPYTFPGSDRKLTRGEFFSVDDLFLDPDCRRADMHDCTWMARRHLTPYWELERKFGLRKDSLKHKATSESTDAMAVNRAGTGGQNQNQSRGEIRETNDLVEWYEIFSKQGVGTRGLKSREPLDEVFEELIGDYAYLCVAKNVDYFLNLPPEKFQKKPDIAKEALAWPVPYHKDARWPVAFLDFHERPNSPWPLAPMAMGLGELIFLNVIVSCLCERVYESSRTIGLAAKSLGADVIERLKNVDFSGWHEVPGEVTAQIDNLIKYVQTPEVNGDVFRMIDMVSAMFDKRTGLTDLLYGLNPGGKVSRSAADINIKQEAVSVRPDWMSRCAENWLTEIANLDRIAAIWSVSGGDIIGLLGEEQAALWDQLIVGGDWEALIRQYRSTIEANSIKKPNKYRDNANIQMVIGYLLPIYKEYWEKTGDAAPLNRFLGQMADAMEQDPEDWELPNLQPPQPPAPDPAAQEMQQLQVASMQEGVKGKKLRNTKLEGEVGAPPADAMSQAPPGMNIDPQYPEEPNAPVSQDSSPIDMQQLLQQMAASGKL